MVRPSRVSSDDHWLLTRLGLTYYEEHNYKKALFYETQALRLAPKCPLVLWDYAGTLEMLGRDKEAIAIYRKLVKRGVDKIAYGECGEGRARDGLWQIVSIESQSATRKLVNIGRLSLTTIGISGNAERDVNRYTRLPE